MAGGEYPWERPLGAVPGGDGTVEFRVWAPHPERVDVRVGGADHELEPEGFGVRRARVAAAAGDDYVFVLDGRELPDPASRHQPGGRPDTPGTPRIRRPAPRRAGCAARRASSTRVRSTGPPRAGTARPSRRTRCS